MQEAALLEPCSIQFWRSPSSSPVAGTHFWSIPLCTAWDPFWVLPSPCCFSTKSSHCCLGKVHMRGVQTLLASRIRWHESCITSSTQAVLWSWCIHESMLFYFDPLPTMC
uniref:Uncharacterized protein n=1 Tax=Anguilla anguilla TaxID=7936 RepID=A0A0E9XGP4_ANGAN